MTGHSRWSDSVHREAHEAASTTIWKIPLEVTDEQTVMIPTGAVPLTVQIQGDTLCLWVHVDPTLPKVERTIWVYGTGNPIPERPYQTYLGTVQDGYFVWHVHWEPE